MGFVALMLFADYVVHRNNGFFTGLSGRESPSTRCRNPAAYHLAGKLGEGIGILIKKFLLVFDLDLVANDLLLEPTTSAGLDSFG